MKILAGDIGGTKTELALLSRSTSGTFAIQHRRRFPSRDHDGLLSVVDAFLAEVTEPPEPSEGGTPAGIGIAGAAFGVAGPVVEGKSHITNLPWVLDAAALSQRLGAPTALLNDFQAVALGVETLHPDELHPLQARDRDPTGPIGVLGAGTGLGQAVLVPTADGPRMLASEGGHTDFAPRSALEVKLLEFLWRRHPRVSVERVVSGLALPSLLDFVRDAGIASPLADTLLALETEDPGAVIGERGQAGSDPACAAALDIFVRAYGAEAGNLALKVLPTGGLFVAGGIAPRLLPSLTDGRFLSALLNKGRMRSVLEAVPVDIVLVPEVGLWGAARMAAMEAGIDGFARRAQ